MRVERPIGASGVVVLEELRLALIPSGRGGQWVSVATWSGT
jgi:hypothetical protein